MEADKGAEARSTHAVDAEHEPHLLVRRFRLVVVAGPDAGAEITSSGDRAVLGTHEASDLRLTDPTVSRFHCELSPAVGRVVVRDLGSRNGTLVNGVSMIEGHARDGATLTLGHTEIRVELRSDEAKVVISPRKRFGRVVGRSPAMRRVFALLERAAASDATVLLEGETGTGKEIAAESIHSESARRDGPFVVVDCGAIPSELLESELFGHEKGAFTGASVAREGAFEAANGGTILLDELGELSFDLQPKLLRVLERREIKRVGTSKYRTVDVRVIAATNRNLRAEVNEKRFRSDLYYRVAVLEVRLAPLRERPEDLPLLVDALLEHLGASDPATAPWLRSPEMLADLGRHAWPGNVRELRNYLERCIAMRERAPLLQSIGATAETDGAILDETGAPNDAPLYDTQTPMPDVSLPFRVARERWTHAFERAYLAAVLEREGGKVTAAARAAGLDRMYFYRLLWRHGLR